MSINIRIGTDSFRKIRENQCTYIDKTIFIEELLSNNQADVTLVTRPRRFGKTLALTTLWDFFDISKQSKDIFDGLAISKNNELCSNWMNKYPTVFITLKSVEGPNFSKALASFKNLVANTLIHNFSFLSTSPYVADEHKHIINTMRKKEANIDDYQDFLLILCLSLYVHYGKPVILLIDEYDVPLANADQNNYYKEMVSFLRLLLGNALKTNTTLQFAVLTGCLRVAKESIFTGINNFKCYGIDNERFSKHFGFTADEVNTLLHIADLENKKDIFKKWYDGYLFGKKTKIYCPWDVLQYISDLKDDIEAEPKTYWMNTSGNDIVRSFLKRDNVDVRKKFETLLSGGCIPVRLNELQTYDSLHSSDENLWNILYLTGYLTKASAAAAEKCDWSGDQDDCVALCLPNREVREVLLGCIKTWLHEKIQALDAEAFMQAIWKGDAEAVSTQLSAFLLKTISYFDDNPGFYHGLVVGLLGKVEGISLQSNREAGDGRFDILVTDEYHDRCAIIEIKQTEKAGNILEQLAASALAQIADRRYDAELETATVVRWGLAFRRKRCVARCAQTSLL